MIWTTCWTGSPGGNMPLRLQGSFGSGDHAPAVAFKFSTVCMILCQLLCDSLVACSHDCRIITELCSFFGSQQDIIAACFLLLHSCAELFPPPSMCYCGKHTHTREELLYILYNIMRYHPCCQRTGSVGKCKAIQLLSCPIHICINLSQCQLHLHVSLYHHCCFFRANMSLFVVGLLHSSGLQP